MLTLPVPRAVDEARVQGLEAGWAQVTQGAAEGSRALGQQHPWAQRSHCLFGLCPEARPVVGVTLVLMLVHTGPAAEGALTPWDQGQGTSPQQPQQWLPSEEGWQL